MRFRPLVAFTVICLVCGCQTNKNLLTSPTSNDLNMPSQGPSYLTVSDPNSCDPEFAVDSLSPDQLADYQNLQYMPISLEECLRQALETSEVFRDLSGTIVTNPNVLSTTFDPALQYTDPTFGEEAALSAFDANFVTGVFFEKNDRPFNNRFSGNADGLFRQDLIEFNTEFSKFAATGTLLNARNTTLYDFNNQAGNRFSHTWETIFESGFRHPLLQGSGSLFNRIAGPSQTPGNYNGILIARTNSEISLSDFEASVREFVSNVENAYWDLYFAYRELEAQTDARDSAQKVLTDLEAKAELQSSLNRLSTEEQKFRFEAAINESLEGRPIEGTRAGSGSSGGTFRRTVGVRVADRRLRFLIGLPITDGTLLQPTDAPFSAPIQFDWSQSTQTAVALRPELRRQRWVVKQRELELTAAKNFLLPRLDLVGNYRFRGLGRDLTGGGTLAEDIASNADNATSVSSAFGDLSSGDFQELQLGAELRTPIGFRRAHAAVRNAELNVQREKSILKEQQRKIVLDLSNSVAEVRRAYNAMTLAEQRYEKAWAYNQAAEELVDAGKSQQIVLLESQRRVLEAKLQFINAEVEYAIAIKNVHFEQATYLDYHGIQLAESESSSKAYFDSQRRNSKRTKPMNYVIRDPSIGRPASDGPANSGQLLPIDMVVYEDGQPVGMLGPGTNMNEIPIDVQDMSQPSLTAPAPGEQPANPPIPQPAPQSEPVPLPMNGATTMMPGQSHETVSNGWHALPPFTNQNSSMPAAVQAEPSPPATNLPATTEMEGSARRAHLPFGERPQRMEGQQQLGGQARQAELPANANSPAPGTFMSLGDDFRDLPAAPASQSLQASQPLLPQATKAQKQNLSDTTLSASANINLTGGPQTERLSDSVRLSDTVNISLGDQSAPAKATFSDNGTGDVQVQLNDREMGGQSSRRRAK